MCAIAKMNETCHHIIQNGTNTRLIKNGVGIGAYHGPAVSEHRIVCNGLMEKPCSWYRVDIFRSSVGSIYGE